MDDVCHTDVSCLPTGRGVLVSRYLLSSSLFITPSKVKISDRSRSSRTTSWSSSVNGIPPQDTARLTK